VTEKISGRINCPVPLMPQGSLPTSRGKTKRKLLIWKKAVKRRFLLFLISAGPNWQKYGTEHVI